MKALTMPSDSTPSKPLLSPPKIVITTPIDSKNTIDFLNCSWTNKYHLQALWEKKTPKLSDKAKKEFAESHLRSQLRQVIHAHPPSDMKMTYIQICGLLSIKPSTDFFKTPNKGKDGLEDMIWENRTKLTEIEKG